MTDFMPENFDMLKISKNYLKLSQLKDGDNKIRIVMKPIAGWLDWHDKKPVRSRPDNKPKKPFDASKPVKRFWDLYVWDYTKEDLYVLEITQNSIINGLMQLAGDEDWGDFTKYDLKIRKEGSGIDTRYSVTPLPHKPLKDEIVAMMKDKPVNLDALFYSLDPWTDLDTSNMKDVKIEAVDQATGVVTDENEGEEPSPLDALKFKLISDGIETNNLDGYLQMLATKSKKEIVHVIDVALKKDRYTAFKDGYRKWMIEIEEEEEDEEEDDE